MESINQRLTAQDMGALPRYADGGLIKSIKSLYRTVTEDRKPDEAPIGTGGASQAKEALTTRKQVLDAAEKKAMGMKGGGKVKGKGTGTSDDVPIMASNGEFMVKAAAVKKLGVPFMKKINAIADGDKPKGKGAIAKMAEKKTGKPHMLDGGGVDEALRRVAPYVDHRPYTGGPPMPEQLRLTNGMPPPGTSVATVPRQGFTYGPGVAPNQPPPSITDVTPRMPSVKGQLALPAPAASAPPTSAAPTQPQVDVQRQAWQGRHASPQAEAWQAERAAGAPSAAQPGQAAPRQAGPLGRAGQSIANAGRAVAGNRVVGAIGRLATPVALGATAASTYDTPTSDYETRFGIDPSTIENPALRGIRDVGVRALGAASDLGNTLTGGIAGQFYRDKQAMAGQLTPADPPAPGTQPQTSPAQTSPGGFDNPAGFPDAVATTKPSAQTVLGATGRDVGGGISRYDVPGKSPLFSNLTGVDGQRSNEALMNRAPITAQNQGALDGIQARQDAAQQSRAQKATYDSQVADAQAANQYELDKNLRAAALGTPSFRGSKAIAPSRSAQTILGMSQRATSDQAGDATTRRGQDIEATRIAGSQQNAAAGQKLAQDKFDLEKDGAKLDNQSRAQLAGLQNVALDPNATPEQRKSALATYRALTGKSETQNRYTVVPGGQAIDPTTNATYTKPSMVIDNQTGQFVEQQGGAKPAQNFESGKTYTDARGNKAKWDGQKFVPV